MNERADARVLMVIPRDTLTALAGNFSFVKKANFEMLTGWKPVADPRRMRFQFGLISAVRFFFITCCTIDRLEQTLLQPAIAHGLLDSIAHRVGKGGWWAHAVTIMPDHVHLVLSFPQEAVITKCIRDWKHWTAHRHGIRWQRDFFEHRLRNDESFDEKVDYVLQNPVRAGLAADWRDWAFTLLAQR